MAYGQYTTQSIPILGVYLPKPESTQNQLPVQRGDIIVFAGKKDYITKRVVGLPKDIVEWNHVDLKINGESTILKADGSFIYPDSYEYTLPRSHHDYNIDEVMDQHYSRIPVGDGGYLKIKTLNSRKQQPSEYFKYSVPKKHFFIVGDNRYYPYYSLDSRSENFGDVRQEDIIGKAVWRLFGSNAKVFNRKRNMVSTIIMLPYLVLRYLMYIDFSRFGGIYEYTEVKPETAQSKQSIDSTKVGLGKADLVSNKAVITNKDDMILNKLESINKPNHPEDLEQENQIDMLLLA